MSLHKELTALGNRLGLLERTVHDLLRDAPWKNGAQSQSPQETPGKEYQRANGHPALVTQVPPPPPNTNKASNPWYKTLRGWKTVGECIAIPFAIGYAIVTYFQWRDLGRNFVVDERAWIAVDEVRVEFNPAGSVPFGQAFMRVELILKNVGKTPARHVTLKGHYEVANPKNRLDVTMPWNIDIPLAPGQRHSIDYWIGSPSASFDGASISRSVQNGNSRAKVQAEIAYHDIFGRVNSTTYCGIYDPRAKMLGYYADCSRSME